MQCEQTRTRFVSARGYNGKLRAREQPCRARATVTASIPFGTQAIERAMCRPCAEKRAAAVLYSRGKVVNIEPLANDAT